MGAVPVAVEVVRSRFSLSVGESVGGRRSPLWVTLFERAHRREEMETCIQPHVVLVSER